MFTSVNFSVFIANELSLQEKNVATVIKLLDEGNTVPFIARYRKEATSNLDEIQIRTIQERLAYLKELEDRRATILNSIESQGKLTETLRNQILACMLKTELEDLYLPFKPKRRTRAAIAREKGLEPLAMRIMEQPLQGSPQQEALAYINSEKEVLTVEDALKGARDIVAEVIAENAEIRSLTRELFAEEGMVISKVIEGKNSVPTKFEQYYDYKEPVKKIPSHRYLAIRRGENEEILDFHIELDIDLVMGRIYPILKLNSKSPFSEELQKGVQDSCKRLLLPSVETDVRIELKLKSDQAAITVFADNLRNLLLAAPLGERAIIGIDPGLRTGCKCAVVDATGKYLDTMTFYLCQGESSLQDAKKILLNLIKRYQPFAIGIGNGTAGRETEAFVRQVLQAESLKDLIVLSVSEAGASVYSASDIARAEFPDLDLTIRGAISIARRLQDPLAELVKVDPKAIGVGQYQHDVHQPLLQAKLVEVVESCVNHVGVEVNTASAPLLAHVAGIGHSLSEKIVQHREKHGAFKSRQSLLEVPGMGKRTFEQAAGFLRVRNGGHPLDSSAVHPERYELVESIAHDLGLPLTQLIANKELVSKINIQKYFTQEVGEHTLKDILGELLKPGRDPRATFEKINFRDDVSNMKDLKIGMKLEGVVTNVTAFGAFVDIGVHQDGLIHISELTDKFIKDPSEVVQAGQRIKVEVLSVDVERKRIALSARIGKPRHSEGLSSQTKHPAAPQGKPQRKPQSFQNNPFANL